MALPASGSGSVRPSSGAQEVRIGRSALCHRDGQDESGRNGPPATARQLDYASRLAGQIRGLGTRRLAALTRQAGTGVETAELCRRLACQWEQAAEEEGFSAGSAGESEALQRQAAGLLAALEPVGVPPSAGSVRPGSRHREEAPATTAAEKRRDRKPPPPRRRKAARGAGPGRFLLPIGARMGSVLHGAAATRVTSRKAKTHAARSFLPGMRPARVAR